MGRLRWIPVLVVSFSVFVPPGAQPATAGGTEGGGPFEDEWGPYPVDFVDGGPLLEKLGLDTQTESFDPLEEACPLAYDPGNEPTEQAIQYKTFRRSPLGPAIPLLIDEWDPVGLPGGTAAPAVVMFHGGSWRHSCRRLFQDEAVAFAQAGYIVFSADYRLTCQPTDNPSVDEAPLCGWQYPTIDLETGTGPPVFIANSTLELVNILNQTDFAAKLQLLNITRDPCTVEGSLHGRAYVLAPTKECNEHPGQTVFDSNLDFFASYVHP